MRIAIVGSGIAGMTAAYRLHAEHDITVFEAGGPLRRPHLHASTWISAGRTYAVDMGFIVFNDRTYPNFIRAHERARRGVADTRT